jgi:hypothetical protein
VSDAPRLLEDTRDLLDAFEDAGVAYVVVGAHALAAHGIPRATGDFDVLVRPDRANATRVLAALRHFGAPDEAHGLEVDGRRLPVLGRAALVKNKRASGRPKDLLDVAALERSSGAR